MPRYRLQVRLEVHAAELLVFARPARPPARARGREAAWAGRAARESRVCSGGRGRRRRGGLGTGRKGGKRASEAAGRVQRRAGRGGRLAGGLARRKLCWIPAEGRGAEPQRARSPAGRRRAARQQQAAAGAPRQTPFSNLWRHAEALGRHKYVIIITSRLHIENRTQTWRKKQTQKPWGGGATTVRTA